MASADSSPSDLLPLGVAVRKEYPEKKLNPSTPWRWVTRGLLGQNGQRIRLQVWYVGREPHTTVTALREFSAAVTAVRLARLQQAQALAADVSEDELNALGLVPPRSGGVPCQK